MFALTSSRQSLRNANEIGIVPVEGSDNECEYIPSLPMPDLTNTDAQRSDQVESPPFQLLHTARLGLSVEDPDRGRLL